MKSGRQGYKYQTLSIPILQHPLKSNVVLVPDVPLARSTSGSGVGIVKVIVYFADGLGHELTDDSSDENPKIIVISGSVASLIRHDDILKLDLSLSYSFPFHLMPYSTHTFCLWRLSKAPQMYISHCFATLKRLNGSVVSPYMILFQPSWGLTGVCSVSCVLRRLRCLDKSWRRGKFTTYRCPPPVCAYK